MQKELVAQGAEAKLYMTKYLGRKALLKERVPKGYRNPALDGRIRFSRTRDEALLLRSAREAGVRTPVVFKIERKRASLWMEFVEGKRLKEALDGKSLELCREAGGETAKMHSAGIVHGDLTTSNIIVEDGKTAFIDFGLGFKSGKEEDFAVDLLNFKKTYMATHCSLPEGWRMFVEGYRRGGGRKSVVERISAIESRARYH